MIDSDALQTLLDAARAGVTVNRIKDVPEPEGRYALQTPKGVEFFTAQSPHRRHTALDLSAVVAFAERFAESAVWYSRAGVVCVTKDMADYPYDRVTLPLAPSAPMAVLQSWEGKVTELQQERAVRLMRTTFADCLANAGDLAKILGSVKLTVNKEQEGQIRQGKSSLGSKLTAEIDGYDTLPDFVTFSVPVFAAGILSTQPVKCALETFPASGAFAFVPIPGQIEAAFVVAEAWIVTQLREMLGESKVPIYYGNA